MKNFFIALLFFNLISYSQEYKFGACVANGNILKTKGSISITEKKVVIIETIVKDKKTITEYEVINKANGILYFTDGVNKNFFNFVKVKGKINGFDYDTVIDLNFDKSYSSFSIVYFCKLQE